MRKPVILAVDDDPEVSNSLVIVMPVFNDWEAAVQLLRQFDAVRSELPARVHFLLVDDGSLVLPAAAVLPVFGDASTTIEVLSLTRNLGHQRAIAVALCHIEEEHECRGVLVMDADGEDPPSGIPALLRQAYAEGNECIVFASRIRRSEGFAFASLYHFYRLLHWILTGVPVRVGNFSYLPRRFLRRLTVSSELWNHYAATILSSKLPFVTVPIARASRLDGRSHMSVANLVSHGLGAISVFSAIAGARVLMFLWGVLVVTLALLMAALVLRVFTPLAVPGWTMYGAGVLLLVLTQLLGVALVFAFFVLGQRSGAQVIPLRDYHFYVNRPPRQRS